ncbi:hypothetical protein ACFYOV_29590 [Streptomyces sp. NPDC005931]|uniref:hypothetical protein n=1 Tax=Streptomyces sp. NPDC005931 TaxID=3364737 RepID=UPI00369644FE
MYVLASDLIDAETRAEYPLLQKWAVARFRGIAATLISRISGRFGRPLPLEESLALSSGDSERSSTWLVSSRLLGLQEYALLGDADLELQLRLAAVELS